MSGLGDGRGGAAPLPAGELRGAKRKGPAEQGWGPGGSAGGAGAQPPCDARRDAIAERETKREMDRAMSRKRR
ncbi:hypothetical protein AMPC_34990 [Anaeromyxobacter paludicola]|uniref:Uncharacterized protein n=1 Tax=Anaeromyxobacter paludicola TaxID=2918171 RepID=A0ABN6NBG6_9BACT|nr:hypothetical protein AMPC_34990 [Anaeromyxobacter paludicola]